MYPSAWTSTAPFPSFGRDALLSFSVIKPPSSPPDLQSLFFPSGEGIACRRWLIVSLMLVRYRFSIALWLSRLWLSAPGQDDLRFLFLFLRSGGVWGCVLRGCGNDLELAR
jgi:hypothetical protein